MGNKAERIYEPDNGEECYVRPSLGRDTAVTFMNSQQQWLPAQGQVSENFIMDEGGSHRAPPLAERVDLLIHQ